MAMGDLHGVIDRNGGAEVVGGDDKFRDWLRP